MTVMIEIRIIVTYNIFLPFLSLYFSFNWAA